MKKFTREKNNKYLTYYRTKMHLNPISLTGCHMSTYASVTLGHVTGCTQVHKREHFNNKSIFFVKLTL